MKHTTKFYIRCSFNFNFVGGDSSCWEVDGRCQSTSEPCNFYGSGLCSGPVDRQCCIIGKIKQ